MYLDVLPISDELTLFQTVLIVNSITVVGFQLVISNLSLSP
ncbi:hypothetical protein ES703_20892 [subsurface metagenome]